MVHIHQNGLVNLTLWSWLVCCLDRGVWCVGGGTSKTPWALDSTSGYSELFRHWLLALQRTMNYCSTGYDCCLSHSPPPSQCGPLDPTSCCNFPSSKWEVGSSGPDYPPSPSLSNVRTGMWTAPSNNDRHWCGYDNNFNSLTLNSIFNFIQPHHVLSHVHYPYLFCCASHLA